MVKRIEYKRSTFSLQKKQILPHTQGLRHKMKVRLWQ